MKCDRIDCENEAKWQLGWKAYALGYSREDHPPIESYMGLKICDDHKESTRITDVTSPEGNAIVNNQLTGLGYAPLDFSQAEVIFHEIIDGKLHMPAPTMESGAKQ